MNTSDDPTPAFVAADKFYFDHLRLMLELIGQGSTGSRTSEHLRLWSVSEKKDGPNILLKLKLTQKLTDYRLRLNEYSGELISWYIDFLAVEGDQSMTVEEATKLAEEIAQPPTDARLQEAEYDIAGGRTFFRSQWLHEHNGLPVEGDFIEVLVNARAQRAFSYVKQWREPNFSGVAVQR